jgi:hypothetical protein
LYEVAPVTALHVKVAAVLLMPEAARLLAVPHPPVVIKLVAAEYDPLLVPQTANTRNEYAVPVVNALKAKFVEVNEGTVLAVGLLAGPHCSV